MHYPIRVVIKPHSGDIYNEVKSRNMNHIDMYSFSFLDLSVSRSRPTTIAWIYLRLPGCRHMALPALQVFNAEYDFKANHLIPTDNDTIPLHKFVPISAEYITFIKV